mmetsp:Transcript_18033/g.31385  ORF Transcript_18033/g.31385 Transcript_18033/m.31385 type:complete len:224 (+) Transcript_18033:1311-1982(+)
MLQLSNGADHHEALSAALLHGQQRLLLRRLFGLQLPLEFCDDFLRGCIGRLFGLQQLPLLLPRLGQLLFALEQRALRLPVGPQLLVQRPCQRLLLGGQCVLEFLEPRLLRRQRGHGPFQLCDLLLELGDGGRHNGPCGGVFGHSLQGGLVRLPLVHQQRLHLIKRSLLSRPGGLLSLQQLADRGVTLLLDRQLLLADLQCRGQLPRAVFLDVCISLQGSAYGS